VTVRVLLVDDEELVRSGLRVVLGAREDLEVVGEAADGAVVVPLVASLRPDVVVMDIRMPLVDGIRATRELRRAHPGGTPRVLVLTTFGDDANVWAALAAGADGFLPKRARPEEIADAVRVLAAGESLLFPAAVRELAVRQAGTRAASGPVAALTPREQEVLVLVARGRSNAEIAAELFLGLQTVKTHVSALLRKLGARDRTQAVVAAYESGLVPLR
jgi:DNA-binding NarL/FixJ family response regulator